MTLTRTEDLPLPFECTATVSMSSTVEHHDWDELVGGKLVKVEDGTVKGEPFLPESFTIPPMEPGETMTRTVWLSDPAIYHESPAAYKYWTYYEALANSNRAWVLLTEGSQLTFEVRGNCMPASEQGPHLLVESAID
jgi:hypothetical protein